MQTASQATRGLSGTFRPHRAASLFLLGLLLAAACASPRPGRTHDPASRHVRAGRRATGRVPARCPGRPHERCSRRPGRRARRRRSRRIAPPPGPGDAAAPDSPAAAPDAPTAADGPDPTGTDATGGTQPNGRACQAASQCESGFCAVEKGEGVCCDRACTGACETCADTESFGTCIAAASGTDPRDDCPETDVSTCGTTGNCDGARKCRAPPLGHPVQAGSSPVPPMASPRPATARAPAPPRRPRTAPPSSAGQTTPSTPCATSAECVSPSDCAAGLCGLLPVGAPCSKAKQCCVWCTSFSRLAYEPTPLPTGTGSGPTGAFCCSRKADETPTGKEALLMFIPMLAEPSDRSANSFFKRHLGLVPKKASRFFNGGQQAAFGVPFILAHHMNPGGVAHQAIDQGGQIPDPVLNPGSQIKFLADRRLHLSRRRRPSTISPT